MAKTKKIDEVLKKVLKDYWFWKRNHLKSTPTLLKKS